MVAVVGGAGFGGLYVSKETEKTTAARPLRRVRRRWRLLLEFLCLHLLLLLLNESCRGGVRSGGLVHVMVRMHKRVRSITREPSIVGSWLPVRHTSPTT